jgi:hypothetical protein
VAGLIRAAIGNNNIVLRRWVLLPLAFAPLAAQTGADRACIEGQVVNQVTGAPVAGAQMKLFGPSGSRTAAAADRKGHFSFPDLDPGEYHIEAGRTGFVPLPFGRMVLTLAAGDQIKDLTVRLTPQAVISGTLLDPDGVPVANVDISLLRHTWRGGRIVLTTAGSMRTNDAGEFRTAGLAAGEYFLVAHPRQLAAPPGDDKVKRIYVATWYPGVTDAGAAGMLRLATAEEHTGAVFTLRTSTVVKVQGRVIRSSLKSEMTDAVAMLAPMDDSGEMDILGAAQASGPEGAFMIPDVPPGTYRIQAHLIDPTAERQALRSIATAAQIIQVGDSDVEGIVLSAALPQTLNGLVTWEGKPPKDTGPCTVSLLRESGVVISDLPPATTKADGTFSLELGPGRFTLNVYCGAKGSYMKAARMNGTDVLETGIDAGEALPAGPLQVTMAQGAGEIEGSVQDTDSHPAGGATVALIPDDSKRPSRSRSAITDQNGHFKLSGVVPGSYSLYAWDQVEDEIWQSEEFIKKYDDRRQRVQLDVGGRQTPQLQLIKVE